MFNYFFEIALEGECFRTGHKWKIKTQKFRKKENEEEEKTSVFGII